MNLKSVAYLGAPYSHSDMKIKEFRLNAVTKKAAQLFSQGYFIYSPLTHNIAISNFGPQASFQTFGKFDLEMLSRCDELLVYKLPGWEESKGLSEEINFAKKNNIPINYIAYELEEIQKSLLAIE